MNLSELFSKFLAKDDYDDEPSEREFKDYSENKTEYGQPKKTKYF